MDSEALTRIAFVVCTAIATIFLVEAVYSTFIAPTIKKREVNRRLRALRSGGNGEQAMLALKAERGISIDNLGLASNLSRLLIQSGLRLTPTKFVAFMSAGTVGVFTTLFVMTLLPVYAQAGIAMVLGVLLPLQFVRVIRNKRIKRFAEQLPEALDVIVRSLRSGHPVPVALSLVGREMADPVGSEFGITVDEMTYGLDLPRAIRNLGERVGLSDLALLITAVSLQSQSGGNLAEVLSNLSKVLRERFQLRRKVRSLSAEGRMSGWGLALLPLMIAAAIFVQTPQYYLDVWSHPMFIPVILGLCAWSLLGDVIMYKMINFKY
jgi:tight adherence protein B